MRRHGTACIAVSERWRAKSAINVIACYSHEISGQHVDLFQTMFLSMFQPKTCRYAPCVMTILTFDTAETGSPARHIVLGIPSAAQIIHVVSRYPAQIMFVEIATRVSPRRREARRVLPVFVLPVHTARFVEVYSPGRVLMWIYIDMAAEEASLKACGGSGQTTAR